MCLGKRGCNKRVRATCVMQCSKSASIKVCARVCVRTRVWSPGYRASRPICLLCSTTWQELLNAMAVRVTVVAPKRRSNQLHRLTANQKRLPIGPSHHPGS